MRRQALRLVGLLSPAQRRQWLLIVLGSAVGAALEAAVAGAIFVLLAVLTEPDQVVTRLGRVPGLAGRTHPQLLTPASVIVACVVLAKNVFLGWLANAQGRAVGASRASLRQRLFDLYLHAPYAALLGRDSSELVERVRTGIDLAVRYCLAGLAGLASEGLVCAGLVAVLLVASPGTTLAAVGVLGALLGVTLARVHRRSCELGAFDQRLETQTLETLQQALEGRREVRVFRAERDYSRRFHALQHDQAESCRRLVAVGALPRLVMETGFVWLALAMVALTAGRDVPAGVLPLLGLYAYAGLRLIPAASRIATHLGNAWYGSTAVDALAEDLRMPGPAPDEAARDGAREFRNELAFEGVSFAFAGGAEVLREIDLRLQKGEALGIVGPSGAGKSTLLDLLLGLLSPTRGRVTLDGRETFHAGWWQVVGYVPQQAFLVDASLRRNVAFGVEPLAIDEGRLREAIHLASLDDVVSSLPEGLATVVGERGSRLSGGERQRLAIARALYHGAEVLVFDEPTSALDGDAEQALKHSLLALKGSRTLVMVAHRPALMDVCDRVVVLREGRLLPAGATRTGVGS